MRNNSKENEKKKYNDNFFQTSIVAAQSILI